MAKTRFRSIAVVVLSAVVVGLGGTTYFYQRDIQRARELASTGSQIVDTPCGRIEYASIGEGRPVLIVHGAGGGFDQSLYFARPLTDRSFRVIAPSRFGYLRTPLPVDASPSAQADAHACLLDALGIRRAAVIGASAGSPSAMQFALRHPQRVAALVLVVPLAYAPKSASMPQSEIAGATEFIFDTALRSDFLFWAAIRLAPRTLIRAILATPPEVVDQAAKEEQDRVMETLYQILPVSPRRPGLLNDGKIATTLPRYELEQIKTPTFIFSSKDDLFQTYESGRYTAEHIPGARFIGFDSGGHIWVGHHNEMLSHIVDSLK